MKRYLCLLAVLVSPALPALAADDKPAVDPYDQSQVKLEVPPLRRDWRTVLRRGEERFKASRTWT